MSGRRRIVTGHDQQGRSIVASDELHDARTSPGLPSVELNYLWGSNETQSYPDAGKEPDWTSHFPPPGGFRFVTYTIPAADFVAPEGHDSAQSHAHALATFPGLLDTYEDDDPGMHTSDTTDVALVLTGEVVLGLADGSTTTLKAGDSIVQNGTAHSWTNHTNEPVEMLFVLLGAHRKTTG